MIRLLYLSGEIRDRLPVEKVSSSYSSPEGMTEEEANQKIESFKKAFCNVTTTIVPL